MRLKVSPEFLLKNSHQNKIEKRRSCQEKLFFFFFASIIPSDSGKWWKGEEGRKNVGSKGGQ